MIRRVISGMMALLIILGPFSHNPVAQFAVAAQDSRPATTTDDLNLRSQPSLTSPVMRIMPRGATVTVRGELQSGFFPVTYGGTDGWAHADYLAVEKPAGTPSQTGTVTESLNMRIGPSTGQRVLIVLPAGAIITITGTSSSGFLAVTYGGYSGYAHGDWIRTTSTPPVVTPAPTSAPSEPSPAGQGIITEDLNLRSQPNTTSTVKLVMPAGAKITLTGNTSGDFLHVQYSGQSGWAHNNWISIDTMPSQPTPTATAPPTPPAPTPLPPTPMPTPVVTPPPTPPVIPEEPSLPPVTSVKGPGRVTESLNLRAEPSTSSAVLLVMPAASRIELLGDVSGLFYKVSYNGTTGWAHKNWIEPESSGVTPVNTARVTETVILRSGPATSYMRIAILPAGVLVTITGQQSNGYHSVAYAGKSGWAFSTYLHLDESAQNLPVLPPGSVSPDSERFPPISTNQGFHYTNAIVGPTRGTAYQAIEYARQSGALRMDDVELYIQEIYRLAPVIGFDPSLLIAQSALETGYWRSYWWVERLNPAGLGINSDPSTHPYSASFPDGTIAARAQPAHMHAEVFGKRAQLPDELQGVDVTYDHVFQAGWAGTIVTLDDLSGTWATDPQYGWKIARVASYIFG